MNCVRCSSVSFSAVAVLGGEVKGVAGGKVGHVNTALECMERVPPLELIGTACREQEAGDLTPPGLDPPVPDELGLVAPEPSVIPFAVARGTRALGTALDADPRGLAALGLNLPCPELAPLQFARARGRVDRVLIELAQVRMADQQPRQLVRDREGLSPGGWQWSSNPGPPEPPMVK
jgi:hypothetical protein